MNLDMKKALELYRKSANSGCTRAIGKLATLYAFGKYSDGEYLMTKDEKQAQKWFDKLIDSDDPSEMYMLGFSYKNRGELKCAIEWWKRVAALNDTEPRHNGRFHRFNSEDALLALAHLYYDDKSKLKDYSKALVYFQRLVDLKGDWYADGLCFMGMIYYEGDFTIKRDLNKALTYFKQSADAGCKEANDWIKDVEERLRIREQSCFVTSAVCNTFGKSDDCYELMAFRNFRDNWLIHQTDGKYLIAEYYRVAPRIVQEIKKLPNSDELFKNIWANYLKYCLEFIENHNYQECKETYIKMVLSLKNQYLNFI